MTTEQNVKQMELKCQQLLKKRNDLLTDIKAKNVEYSIVQNRKCGNYGISGIER